MVELMTTDIEWISVVDVNVQEKVPAEVMKAVFAPADAVVGELFAGAVRVSHQPSQMTDYFFPT
jgi:hypothetical protein